MITTTKYLKLSPYFCGEHNILPEVEMINMQYINTAYERMLKNDVKYRFVIDIEKSL